MAFRSLLFSLAQDVPAEYADRSTPDVDAILVLTEVHPTGDLRGTLQAEPSVR